MKQHVSSIHEGNKPFACKLCPDVRFRGKPGLNGHHATVHDTANAYHCPLCNLVFAQRNGLKTHIGNIHEGTKPHACNICDYATTQKSTLKQHIQQVHVE